MHNILWRTVEGVLIVVKATHDTGWVREQKGQVDDSRRDALVAKWAQGQVSSKRVGDEFVVGGC